MALGTSSGFEAAHMLTWAGIIIGEKPTSSICIFPGFVPITSSSTSAISGEHISYPIYFINKDNTLYEPLVLSQENCKLSDFFFDVSFFKSILPTTVHIFAEGEISKNGISICSIPISNISCFVRFLCSGQWGLFGSQL